MAPDITCAQFAITRNDIDSEGVRFDIGKVDGSDWHVALICSDLDIKEGTGYSFSFDTRSDGSHPFSVQTSIDEPDWLGIGSFQCAIIGISWQHFSYPFQAQDTIAGHGKVLIILCRTTGAVWLWNVSLTSTNT